MNRKKLISILLFGLLVSSFLSVLPYASATVTWSYNSGTNTATASGTGTTNFSALVAADSAGGWGKFTADSTGTQILCQAKIVIGDGTNTCTFIDTNKEIVFKNAISSDYGFLLTIKNHSNLTLGTINDINKKTSSSGVTIIYLDNYYSNIYPEDGATCNFYSCSIIGQSKWLSASYNAKNSNFWNSNLQSLRAFGGCDIYNIKSEFSPANGAGFYGNNTVNKLFITDAQSAGIYLSSGGITKNLFIRNSGYKAIICNDQTAYRYLINPDIDTWNILFEVNTKIYRQYEYDIQVLNGDITDFVEDANVTLSKNGNIIGSWLTNSSGQIPIQTLTYGYYQQSTGDTLQDGTYPFVLTVTHDDWQTYVSRFYVTEKTKMTISMQEIQAEATPDPEEYTPNEDVSTYNFLGILTLIGIIVFAIFWSRVK